MYSGINVISPENVILRSQSYKSLTPARLLLVMPARFKSYFEILFNQNCSASLALLYQSFMVIRLIFDIIKKKSKKQQKYYRSYKMLRLMLLT